MKKTLGILVLILLIAFGGYYFYQKQQEKVEKTENKTEEEVIKIGAILPLTGKYAGLGEMMNAGFLIAINDINKENDKYKYQPYVEDAQSDSKTALSAYQKLKNIDNVNIYLTGSSALSLALKPNIIKDENLLLGIASHPALTSDDSGYILRPCNRSIDESIEMARFINSDSIVNKDSWLIYYNSEFGDSFRIQLEKDLKNKIIGETSYDEKTTNLKGLMSKIITKNPSNVLIIGFTPAMGRIIKTLRELGYKNNIIANLGMTSPSVNNAAGDASKGVYFVNYDFPFESKFAKSLDSIAKAKYKTHFSSFSFLTYYGIKVLNKAIAETKSTDVKSITTYFDNIDSIKFDNITFKITKDGDILPPLTIQQK